MDGAWPCAGPTWWGEMVCGAVCPAAAAAAKAEEASAAAAPWEEEEEEMPIGDSVLMCSAPE